MSKTQQRAVKQRRNEEGDDNKDLIISQTEVRVEEPTIEKISNVDLGGGPRKQMRY